MERSSLWQNLIDHYNKEIKHLHLRELLQDEKRNAALKIELPNLLYDFSHEKLTEKTIQHFQDLVKNSNLWDKIEAMFSGVKG